MSDFRNDPNLVHREMSESDTLVQWTAVAVILLLVGGMIFAAAYSGGGDSQTAMNSPAAETTGSGGSTGSAQTMPAPPRQLRH